MHFTVEKYIDEDFVGVISAHADQLDAQRYRDYLETHYAEILEGKSPDTVGEGISFRNGEAKNLALIQWARSGAFTSSD